MLTAASAINGPHDPVMMPQGGTQLDWEAELAVVFCKAGEYPGRRCHEPRRGLLCGE